MGSDHRRLIAALAGVAVLVSCTGGTGSEGEDGDDRWAQRTREAMTAAIRADPDGPIPVLELPTPTEVGLLDRAAAALVVGGGSDLVEDLAAERGPDGLIDDGLSPVEVLTWYAARLGVEPSAGTSSAALVGLADDDRDLYTDLYWSRLVEDPTPVPDVSWACPGADAAMPDAVIRAAAAREMAQAVGAPGCGSAPDDLAQRTAAWLDEVDDGGPLDAFTIEALVAAADLGLAPAADAALRRAVETGAIEETPSVVLLAVDRLDRAGEPVELDPALGASLEAIADGSGTVVLAPNPLRVLLAADVIRTTGGNPAEAIDDATAWDDPELDPLDRLLLAVAAEDRDRLDLAALRRADPGPITATLAWRAQGLVGAGCDGEVERFVERTVDEVEREGAPTAENPYTASGYAALVALADRCGVRSPVLVDLRSTVEDHVSRADGTDPRRLATAGLAACRLDVPGPPLDHARRTETISAATLDDILAAATLDVLAADGCEAVR